ncbi:MAG: hypothetical protein AAF483_25840 [Planctomycetota bacterium]
MIHLQNTSYDDESSVATYALAQYFGEPLRQEARNVGVLVERGGQIAMRFVGESHGKWDASALRFLAKPSVYKLWVDSWRSKSASSELGELLSAGSEHFHIVEGGEITAPSSDEIDTVCNYLFGVLVSRGGMEAALTETTADNSGRLRNDLLSSFRELDLLANSNKATYPINPGRPVKGRESWHTVAFFQEGPKECTAMEPLDITIKSSVNVRNHASFLHIMFEDLRGSKVHGKPVSTVAVVRGGDSNLLRENDEVQYIFGKLEKSNQIVDWTNLRQKKAFLNRVEQTAFSAPLG